MKVRLIDVIEAMEFANDESHYLYDTKKEKIIFLWNGMVDGEEDEELYEDILDSCCDQYISLPDKYDIHEYHIMEEFVDTVSSNNMQVQLYNALRGKGAFRRFKDTIYQLNIEQQWYKFRDEQYVKIAREWCLKHKIDIIEGE